MLVFCKKCFFETQFIYLLPVRLLGQWMIRKCWFEFSTSLKMYYDVKTTKTKQFFVLIMINIICNETIINKNAPDRSRVDLSLNSNLFLLKSIADGICIYIGFSRIFFDRDAVLSASKALFRLVNFRNTHTR